MTNTSEFSSRQSVHARNITLGTSELPESYHPIITDLASALPVGMFVLDTFKYLDERGQDLNIAREQQVRQRFI